MANEYVFENEHFAPKFSASFLYRGLEEVWVGDGNSETREEDNDKGYLYTKYHDGRIVRVGKVAPELDESVEAAEEAARNAESNATLAESYKSEAERQAELAEQSKESATEQARQSRLQANSAALSSQIASSMENYATQERYKSEGYACGTKDGVDVDAGSEYYHNNAKYYYDMIVTQGGGGGISVTNYDLYSYFNWDSYLLENSAPGQMIIYLVGPFLIGFIDLKMRDDVQGEVSDTVQFYSNGEPLYHLDATRSITLPIVAWTDWTARQEIGAATFSFSLDGSIIDLSISREALPDGYLGTVSAYIRGFFVLPLVKTIGNYAFRYCYGLKGDLVLPTTCTSIGQYSFANCNEIETFRADGAISTLGTYTFNGASGHVMTMRECHLPHLGTGIALNVNWGSATAANACQHLEICDVGNAKSIAANTFANCYKLQTLILRRTSVTTLANVSAFLNTPMRGRDGLTGKIYVPESLIESYKAAKTWVTLFGYGFVTFEAIEGSEWEL